MTRRRESEHKSSKDPVRSYLKSRGASSHVVDAGLQGAVARWESIAGSVDGYDFNLDDWLNDMDLRDIIAGAIRVASDELRHSVSRRLEQADDRIRKATVVTGPIWGTKVAAAHSHDPDHTWWYFRVPINPGETLRSDLERAGLK